MKTHPEATTNSVGNTNIGLNRWSLKFQTQQTEAFFQKYLMKRQAKSLANSQLDIFQLCYLIVLLIYIITYLLQLLNYPDQRSLIFQLILIVFCIIISSGLYCNHLKMKNKMNVLYKIDFFSLIFAEIMLILNDFYFQKLIFSDVEQLYLNSLPGLISLTLFNIQTFSINYQFAIIGNAIILFLYAFFRLYQSSSLASSLLEIFLLFSVQIYQTVSIYLLDYSNRKRFIAKITKGNSTESEKLIQLDETDQVDFRIQDCLNELNSLLPLMQDDFKNTLEKTIGLLKNISVEYKNKSFFTPNIESITKGLDEEDKIYIQQS